ncbi:HNH endonuclease [Clostridium polynesiense]|uniref:HNH endonuclease n=1 Tax=Clostridium polynesiense TaxID=1325933 RepID=UPI00058D94BB|nr:HNH endonuclease [Clostridium polynesiense]
MNLTEEKVCELCERKGVETTVHHLVPKEEGGRNMATVNLCIPCHRQIHALYSNRDLGLRLNTLEKLKKDEKISRYLHWIKKQNNENIIRIKNSRERRMKK